MNSAGPRARLRQAIDNRFGQASTGIVCLAAYALALVAALWSLRLTVDASPYLAVLAAMTAATLVIFAIATLLDNASVYDPFWSVAPPLVMLYLMAQTDPGPRAWLVFALVLAWSLRLTWNCLARWPQLSAEDFRYQDLRRKTGRVFWLVNLAGIEMFPTLLVYLGCLPLVAAVASDAALGWLDLAALAVGIAALAIETLADRQLRAHLRDPNRTGILTSGVWGLSQHPNYLGEIGFWWALFLFGLAAGAPLWTVVGALAMTALFWFISIPMMLERKRRRHPGYDAQVAGIPVLIPGLKQRQG